MNVVNNSKGDLKKKLFSKLFLVAQESFAKITEKIIFQFQKVKIRSIAYQFTACKSSQGYFIK